MCDDPSIIDDDDLITINLRLMIISMFFYFMGLMFNPDSFFMFKFSYLICVIIFVYYLSNNKYI